MAIKVEQLVLWIYTILTAHSMIPGDVHVISAAARTSTAVDPFKEHPADTVLTTGGRDRLRLRCALDVHLWPGIEVISVQWVRDGKNLNNNKATKITDDGTLVIKRASRKKNIEGKYHCLVETSLGSMRSLPATITLATEETTYVSPRSLTSTEGGQGRFECVLPPQPSPPSITWMKDGKPLTHNRWQSSGNVLVLWDVTEEDDGKYACSSGKDLSTTGSQLQVINTTQTDSSTSLVITGPSSVRTGESILLQCVSSSQTSQTSLLPQPSTSSDTISWGKDGIALSEDQRVLQVSPGILWIKQGTSDDRGSYTCGSNDIASQPANLTVIVPPLLLAGPEEPTDDDDGPATLRCVFAGTNYSDLNEPLAHGGIRWTLNGAPVTVAPHSHNNNDDGNEDYDDYYYDYDDDTDEDDEPGFVLQRDGSLIIKKRDAAHSGGFQCWAENSAGTAMAGVFVAAKLDVAKPDLTVEVTVLSSSEVRVVWSQDLTQSRAEVIAYCVHYRIHIPDATKETETLELQIVSLDTEKTIRHLKPSTNYSIYVSAYTSGQKYESKTSYVTTLEDVPVSAPVMSVYAAGPYTLLIQWEILPPDLARGKIVKHQIWYMDDTENDNAILVGEFEGNITEVILDDLEPETTYYVRVLSATSQGYPTLHWDKWPSQKTYSIPGPLTLQARALNATSIVASWTKSSDASMAAGSYNLLYSPLPAYPDSRNLSKGIVLDSSKQDYQLNNLDANVWYRLSIYPCAGKQAQDCNQPTHTTLKLQGATTAKARQVVADRIQPPEGIVAETLGSTSIQLMWRRPTGNIKRYDVRYAPMVLIEKTWTADVEHTKTLPCKEEVALLDKLEPYTKYEIHIQTVGQNIAKSNYGDPVIAQTAPGIPSAPTNVSYQLVKEGTALIKWSPPLTPAGPIVKYTVFCAVEKLAEDDEWTSAVANSTSIHVLTELLEDTVYYVKLSAWTVVGQGPFSETLYIDTAQALALPQSSVSWMKVSKWAGAVTGICILLCAVWLIYFFHKQCKQCCSCCCCCCGNRHRHGNGNGHAASAHHSTPSAATQYTAVCVSNGNNGYVMPHHGHPGHHNVQQEHRLSRSPRSVQEGQQGAGDEMMMKELLAPLTAVHDGKGGMVITTATATAPREEDVHIIDTKGGENAPNPNYHMKAKFLPNGKIRAIVMSQNQSNPDLPMSAEGSKDTGSGSIRSGSNGPYDYCSNNGDPLGGVSGTTGSYTSPRLLPQHCSMDDIDHTDASSSSAGGTLSSRHSHDSSSVLPTNTTTAAYVNGFMHPSTSSSLERASNSSGQQQLLLATMNSYLPPPPGNSLSVSSSSSNPNSADSSIDSKLFSLGGVGEEEEEEEETELSAGLLAGSEATGDIYPDPRSSLSSYPTSLVPHGPVASGNNMPSLGGGGGGVNPGALEGNGPSNGGVTSGGNGGVISGGNGVMGGGNGLPSTVYLKNGFPPIELVMAESHEIPAQREDIATQEEDYQQIDPKIDSEIDSPTDPDVDEADTATLEGSMGSTESCATENGECSVMV